jgi:hypothetical protein
MRIAKNPAYLKNPEAYNRRAKAWREANKERHDFLKKRWAVNNVDKVKAYQAEARWKRHGIVGATIEVYRKLQVEQKDCCAICIKPRVERARALALDHNHETGKIRGLLCQSCNYRIGIIEQFRRDNLLDKVLDYIQ